MNKPAEDHLTMSVTRFIAAPPEKVWQIMTERQTEWWCPLPWRAEIIEQDWRAGGRSSMVMRGPEGEEHPDDGIFLEVVPGRRWVATDAVTRGAVGTLLPSGPFMIGCWEIAPEGDGTRYTATARHWTEEAASQHASMGFHEGWGAAADQLKVLCEAT
ncbi:MAG: ATPase [Erythrobacter sp.]|nr:ATPase [Erythrobacter sp.]